MIFASACVKDRFEHGLGVFFDLSPPCLLPGAWCLLPGACCLPLDARMRPLAARDLGPRRVDANCPNVAGLVLQQGWCCSKIGSALQQGWCSSKIYS